MHSFRLHWYFSLNIASVWMKKKPRKKDAKREHRTVPSDKEAFLPLILINILYTDICYRHRRALSTFLAAMALIRQWRLSTFRQRGMDWWRRDIHMPDPASGLQLPGYDFCLQELEGPKTRRKLHAPDMTLAKNELARGARLPHPGSWCESRLFPLAPSQTVPLWAIELTQPQFPQEYCQCFPACLYPKYFQFTQDINRHCCRRTLVQLYIRDIWLN